MNYATRFKNYIQRFYSFGKKIKPAYKAPFYFITRHFFPKKPFSFTYKNHNFFARNIDYSAIREIFFEEEYAFLLPFLKNNNASVVIDVGAHIGLFSLWVLENSPKSKIVSVEASPDTYNILKKTNSTSVKRHGYDWKTIHRAAWKNDDILAFAGTGDAMSHRVNNNGNAQVRGIPLQELLDMTAESKIDLMKVDIEGAEEAFLCENPHLLQYVDTLVIELHAKYCNAERVRDLLDNQYSKILSLSNRASSKALLYCTRGHGG